MEIVVINGAAGSGKDTFVSRVVEILGEERCYNYSTIDFVKYLAIIAGWKGSKTPKDRKFLSDLKRVLTDWDDLPYKITEKEIESTATAFLENGHFNDSVMFIHCREPEEIERLATNFMAHTLIVRRAAAEEVKQINKSDNEVYNYSYEYVIENNGALEELTESAKTYIVEALGLKI